MLASPARGAARDPGCVFRFSVDAMESPRDERAAYARLVKVLEERLRCRVQLVQRKTYRELNDLLIAGQVDGAMLCTAGYLDLERRAPAVATLAAVPMVGGSTTYQALVIVPASSSATELRQLEGKRFAFTDELSLAGRTYVVHELQIGHQRPDTFFGAISYTGSHDASIAAIAKGAVDGAAVHGWLFSHFVAEHPAIAARVRVIDRSPEFAGGPVVLSTRLSSALRARAHHAFLTLGDGADGAATLRALRVDRFVPADPAAFASARRVLDATN